MRSLLVVCLFVAASAWPAAAQSTDRWQFTLAPTTDGAEAAVVWDVTLVRLDADTLIVRQHGDLVAVPVAQLTEIRCFAKTAVAFGGTAQGASILAAITGRDDEIIDLAQADFSTKLEAVRQILRTHVSERDREPLRAW